ncbi:MAG: EF-P beta-lysylation protein EpmB [Planctomycetales bacterium]|nr:EF-P beta-lysylation protein EpmB [Planctomycetales bacterium]
MPHNSSPRGAKAGLPDIAERPSSSTVSPLAATPLAATPLSATQSTILGGSDEFSPDRPQRAASPEWQRELQQAVRDDASLRRLTGHAESNSPEALSAAAAFRVLAPLSYMGRIRSGDATDPLLRQVLPSPEETRETPGFSHDPVGDAAAERAPGLLQKYQGRALLVTTSHCAVHCRYCFRRSYPYNESPNTDQEWEAAWRSISDDATIREVILSGGDPLTLSDARLSRIAERLAAIERLKTLRIHTRLPIVIPSRVDDALLAWLEPLRLAKIVVLHANHANELDAQVAAAAAKLRSVGVLLLNQAVLLAGVNDSVDAQADLCERLIEIGVLPYYLHQLDRVYGAAHFETPVARGREIMADLQARLPGYATPRYVQEVAGCASKQLLYP